MMKYAVSTPVSTEPVSLADARLHLRINAGDTSEDTAIIAPLITAAREYCENVTGRALAAQTIKAYPERFTRIIQLPREPMVSVSAITYTDESGVTTTMASSNYIIDTVGGTVAIKELPTFSPRLVNPIEITYSAGYTLLPKAIRQAMLLLIGHWYENREAVVVGAYTLFASVEVSMAVNTLLRQYKARWF